MSLGAAVQYATDRCRGNPYRDLGQREVVTKRAEFLFQGIETACDTVTLFGQEVARLCASVAQQLGSDAE